MARLPGRGQHKVRTAATHSRRRCEALSAVSQLGTPSSHWRKLIVLTIQTLNLITEEINQNPQKVGFLLLLRKKYATGIF